MKLLYCDNFPLLFIINTRTNIILDFVEVQFVYDLPPQVDYKNWIPERVQHILDLKIKSDVYHALLGTLGQFGLAILMDKQVKSSERWCF